ncbi:MAG: hypothetical protein K9K66_02810 [Desulfarculaceae bacterium]|nr:hypothetical protein [Desulfarculaceae bacterium]MCF8070979.1 hypothetical protein [Desulfarculaceae bacterium]MCF8100567.1 hypothetical protein [Desulfarculaceae bacterium]MCF8116593.1 hypothetical protein [Desulfarculaceae bacterium]
MSRNTARLIAALVLALAVFLPGCFDYDLELVLEPKLNGRFTATVHLPQSLAKTYSGGPDEIVTPIPRDTRGAPEHGEVDLDQTVSFAYLEKLQTKRVRFRVERVNFGFIGVGDDTYRLTGWLRSLEGDRPDRDQPLGTELDNRLPAGAAPPSPEDPAAARAQELLAASLAGRFVTMTYVVPGEIVKAWGLNIAGQRVEPQVEAERGVVRWRVPLSLLATAKVRHTLVFRADFKGDVEFKAVNITEVESKWGSEKPLPGKAALRPGAAGAEATDQGSSGEAAQEQKTTTESTQP